ncbi:hypothetical protein [Actinomadura sp. NTSP31]|uniref:hypothetical protein n=1 Tax=Actinomadura sp. NTSP31 TaxID=1735447 RepID=UPI0035C1A6D8
MEHTRPEQAASPAGRTAAEERARAAGTADPAVAGDTHVAGPPPKPPEAAEDTSPDPLPAAGLADGEVATGFPSPGTGGAQPGLRPTASRLGGVPERLLDPADAERFRERWRDVQSAFVDDPADSVRKADTLAAEVVDALSGAVAAHRRTLSEDLGKHDEPDTERLRLALRGYRDLLDRIFAA